MSASAAPRRSPMTHDDTVHLNLFAAFMRRCQFTDRFVSIDRDLLCLIRPSKILYDITLAIGALEASRMPSCTRSYPFEKARAEAFTRYGSALKTLRHRLAKAEAIHSEDMLWGTFLFSLFELSTEASGEQFAKHMFHGTSTLLALVGPSGLSTQLHQKLFDAFRALEVNRAILFADGTILSQPIWVSHQSSNYGELSKVTDRLGPMDAIMSFKLRVATFSKRFFEEIESIDPRLRSFHPTMKDLAQDGVIISQELSQWYQDHTRTTFTETAYTLLALIDFHALKLFLSQAYSYYTCWDGLIVPSLAEENVEVYVKSIIELAEKVQSTPHVPGVLLLFALRMAGAHATNSDMRRMVIKQLEAISQEGFVVSERIRSDLQGLWAYQRQI